jgi:hypothetical protein
MNAVAVEEVTGLEEECVELGGGGGNERGCGAFGSEEEREALLDEGVGCHSELQGHRNTGRLDEI